MSRVDKVAEEIRKEVSQILQQEMNDPRVGFTTVTRVELTPDLRFARIFYSVYGTDKQWEDTQEGLTHAIPFIRRLIGERIQLRFVPEILFKSDHSAEYSIRVEEELQAIHAGNAGAKKKRKVSDGPKSLCDALRKKENKVYLVFSHIHQEGDALGSQLAVVRLLRTLGKTAIAINEDLPPQEYSFLPGLKSIRHPRGLPDYDVAVFVDCSDISRIGKLAKLIRRDRVVVNIDHHISNTRFGDLNWIVPEASSASEMVYELFRALHVPLTKADAELLYTGIFVDTGSFKYRTTSARTHEVASALLKHRLDVYGIYQKLYEDRDFNSVKAVGRILNTLRLDKTGRVAWLEVNAAMIKMDPTLVERTDDLVGFARSIKGVSVALLFKEVRRGKEVRVNLRSRGRADVNEIARVFGGGGHKMASGCTWHGTLKEAVARIVPAAAARCR